MRTRHLAAGGDHPYAVSILRLDAYASSGNVFADLELPNAEELETKVQLAASLNAILAARKLTQAEAARVLGVNQPKVSALKG